MFKCFPLPFCSRNLEQIDKRHCNLTTVPDDVLRYTRTLEELLLDANQLQDLPKVIIRKYKKKKKRNLFLCFFSMCFLIVTSGRLSFNTIASINI